MSKLEVDARKVVGKLTLTAKVTHLREVSFRIWLGSKFMKLAAWIIGCGIEICDRESEGEPLPESGFATSKLSLEKNDIVVVHCDRRISDEHIVRMSEGLKSVLGQERKVIVLGEDVRISAIGISE